jgi:hypothetical protein
VIAPAVGGFSLGVSAVATWTVALGLSLELAFLTLVLKPAIPRPASG